jgi:hypothetical protein
VEKHPLVESAIKKIEIASQPISFSKKPLFIIFRRAIRESLRMLPLSVINLPRKIVVFAGQEERQFEIFDYDDGSSSRIDGQVEKDNVTVSLCSSFYEEHCRSRNYLREVVWHEIAHVYHFYLQNSAVNIDREWRAVARDVYNYKRRGQSYVLREKQCWRDEYPADGLISEYSTSNINEDIADFFAQIYLWLWNRASVFNKPDFLTSDQRYIKKIKLLYKYGFITARTYYGLMGLYKKSPVC